MGFGKASVVRCYLLTHSVVITHSLTRLGYPYAYLSPGEFTVAVRLDMENFRLSTVKMVDLSTIDESYGGYSGGFTDGSWACFNPFRSFIGPVGGRRSDEPVDKGSTKVFYQSTMVRT